jgi:hypothetical protein
VKRDGHMRQVEEGIVVEGGGSYFETAKQGSSCICQS